MLEILDAMHAARRRTLDLVGHLSTGQLEHQIDPIMSPLVWDLAHIAAYEDLWLVHRFAGEPLLRPDLAAVYDAFETPRTVRGEIELLDTARARTASRYSCAPAVSSSSISPRTVRGVSNAS